MSQSQDLFRLFITLPFELATDFKSALTNYFVNAGMSQVIFFSGWSSSINVPPYRHACVVTFGAAKNTISEAQIQAMLSDIETTLGPDVTVISALKQDGELITIP